ncbi:CLUMA_CG012886, isoform A [Clunio marinus]|uniref:CLUMA_CG012886, isoform A n=1 Tax=Clunio marinus TaxID=568069 RepID=A0A1J1IJ51_9DIPT|nr:CLUMA_CG012886, isoform A [Clunio marinus]
MEVDEEATQSIPKDIKHIASETVLKICSSQVILNLAIAVKEVLENAIDAGAKVVEIKIKNYGADGFDVIDNGSGITEENFIGITAKHSTSKIKEFSDLGSITTFGFRGEALSSLCACSNVTITTRHKSSEHASKLTFNHNGEILNKLICARNVGTTVSVTDFFITLPVRRREFLKNYKKDFNKMVQLIQEYCLVLKGVKVICTNQPPSGARQTVLSTNGVSVMENIISIFGAKQAKSLIKITSPTEDGTDEGTYTQQSVADLDTFNSVLDINQPELDYLNMSRFKIEGFVSNIEHNCARSSKDRQYFYINSRPVELRSISKIINDVYHRYNVKQFPFIYVNLKMDQSNVDVNLSKDKRQVAVCHDKILQLAVKRSLLNTYGELPSKFRIISVNNSVKNIPTNEKDSDEEHEEDKIMVLEPGNKFGKTLKQWKINPKDPTPPNDATTQNHKRRISNEIKSPKKAKINFFFHKTNDEDLKKNSEDEKSEVSYRIDCSTTRVENSLKFEKIPFAMISTEENLSEETTQSIENNFSKMNETPENINLSQTVPTECLLQSERLPISQETTQDLEKSFLKMEETSENINISETIMSTLNDSNTDDDHKMEEASEVIEVDSYNLNVTQSSTKIDVSLDELRTMAFAEENAFEKWKEEKASKKIKLRFKEKINPSSNKKAEMELETEIKKEMFGEMEVLGQFNLGFIIAKLNSDLFIVDQHASDEKYNFEDLQKTTKLQSQPLVIPERLELTAIQEMTLIENLHIFAMNGFKFLIDENETAGQKIKIHSKPFSKNWEFGKEDIEEMIFMLDNAPNTICRPSRVRTMLASRACRKSVMIGDALKEQQMKQIVEHMGELDHPWNCPHGRPTLRYLHNLDLSDEQL